MVGRPHMPVGNTYYIIRTTTFPTAGPLLHLFRCLRDVYVFVSLGSCLPTGGTQILNPTPLTKDAKGDVLVSTWRKYTGCIGPDFSSHLSLFRGQPIWGRDQNWPTKNKKIHSIRYFSQYRQPKRKYHHFYSILSKKRVPIFLFLDILPIYCWKLFTCFRRETPLLLDY